MPSLSASQWLLTILAALGIGVAKSGLAGVSMLHVLIFASIYGARESTGIVLPMLIVGDICAVQMFRQHAQWTYIRRMLPPACTGVVIGWLLMNRINEAAFKPLIGSIILVLSLLQVSRYLRPHWFSHIPHLTWFAWTIGLLAGITTMLANAAGPIMALYFLAVALPKLEFAGTSAWFFLVLNVFKIPFSLGLGLIHEQTLLLNLILVPFIVIGITLGRPIVQRIPQRLFDGLLLAFVAIAALRMIGLFPSSTPTQPSLHPAHAPEIPRQAP